MVTPETPQFSFRLRGFIINMFVMKSIFVSYASADITHVNSLIAKSTEIFPESLNLWISFQKKDNKPALQPGENWKKEINDAIDDSEGAILFVSKSFLNSEIIYDFELPLIFEKKKRDNNYKIYPILVDEADYLSNPYTKDLHFTNSPSTSLEKLTGRKYQLEIEDLSRLVLEDYKQHPISSTIIRSSVFIAILFPLLLFTNNYFSSNKDPDIEIIDENIVVGVGDCFDLVSESDQGTVDILLNENLNDETSQSYLLNPFVTISNKVDCINDHQGQVVSKKTIYRKDDGTLKLPGAFLGIYTEEDCYINNELNECDGAIVTDTVPGSAAYDNQLMPGDIIQVLNGYYIFSTRDLAIALSSFSEEDINSYNILGIKSKNKNLENKIFKFTENTSSFGNESAILQESAKLCDIETLNYQPNYLDTLENFVTDDFEFYVTPLINKEDIDKEKIEIYCVMYLINVEQEKWKTEKFSDIIEYWSGNIINDFLDQFKFKNWAEFYQSKKTFYQIKTLEDLDIGDCMYYEENLLEDKANDKLFPVLSDCNALSEVEIQILAETTVSLSQNNLILESDEFNNFIKTKCRNEFIKHVHSPSVSYALFSQFFSESSETIRTPLLTRAYWKQNNDDIVLKCGFFSADIDLNKDLTKPEPRGFLMYEDVFDNSETFNELEAGFVSCPKYSLIGDGYYVNNNLKPYPGEQPDFIVVVPSWKEGNYPVERMTVQIANNNNFKTSPYILPFVENEDKVNRGSSIVWSSYAGLDLKDHTYLQNYKFGTLPAVVIVDKNYEGELDLTFRVYDTSGAQAWANCKTEIVKNPKDEITRQAGIQSEITRNYLIGESKFDQDVKIDFDKIDVPKITYVNFYGTEDQMYLDLVVNAIIKPERMFLSFKVCEFPRNESCFSGNSFNNEYSFYKQRVHLLEEDAVKKYGSLGVEKVSDNFYKYNNLPFKLEYSDVGFNRFFSYEKIPLALDPCSKVDYDYFEEARQNPIYKFNFDCVDPGFEKIGIILDNITFPVLLFTENQCEISYNGFKHEGYDSYIPDGQSITFSSFAGNCGWMSDLENLPRSSPIDSDNIYYLPNFNFEEITNMELYQGAPIFYLYP